MPTHPSNSRSQKRSRLTFLVLVFTLSTLFWGLGAVTEPLLPDDRPIDLSICDPVIAGIITALVAAAVVCLWGPATLARYRTARLGQDVQPSAAH